jgi:hypothetical protein
VRIFSFKTVSIWKCSLFQKKAELESLSWFHSDSECLESTSGWKNSLDCNVKRKTLLLNYWLNYNHVNWTYIEYRRPADYAPSSFKSPSKTNYFRCYGHEVTHVATEKIFWSISQSESIIFIGNGNVALRK